MLRRSFSVPHQFVTKVHMEIKRRMLANYCGKKPTAVIFTVVISAPAVTKIPVLNVRTDGRTSCSRPELAKRRVLMQFPLRLGSVIIF